MDVGALINEQYKVIEHIGRGGMADVWSARDTRLRRLVAIKTILSGFGQNVDPVALFKREAQTIAALEHPHILPVHDFGEHEGALYIVMRYITGGSLEDELRDGGPMPVQEVLHMAHDIGRALDYAHNSNVIHLDLKPPNILLDSSRSPYLADFGLATVLDTQGRATNPGSGTLLYMAPEQIISETIDHRADIYAFSIMLFHMLTGKLPFEGSNPLAMAQIQLGEQLPDLETYRLDIPADLIAVLRQGTAQDPNHRPDTHAELVEQFRAIVQPSSITIEDGSFDRDGIIGDEIYDLPTELYDADMDANLLEAVDIYSRARVNWQGGQGRFLLGVTHYMLMSDYYQYADDNGLTIDREGYQMLLRGAIEYDYELDYWWDQVNSDDDRRWVCLHALRSGNSPARIRSLYRLETLPDEEGTAIIPRLVTQALEIETDDRAKIAALRVLGTRARLYKDKPSLKIKTQYRGRLLTSMTRLGIEINPPDVWSEQVYSRDVDVLVAEQAFDPSEAVAEFAARTVGKMRSLAAIEHLANEQENGREGALQALAFVRDEAPALPDSVDREARFYAWITNTVRRLTENPVQMMLHLALAFLAGWIAMGNHIWSYFRVDVGTLSNARWANTLGLGISFGLFVAITYFVTLEVSRRLEGFWAWWMRLLLTGILGFTVATLSFASFRYLFMQEPASSILWDEMRLAGAGLAFGLVATALLRLRGWQGTLLTTLTTFVPIFITYRAFYFSQETTIIPLAAFGLLLGIFCGWQATRLTSYNPRQFDVLSNRFAPLLIGTVLAFVWVSLVWWQFDVAHARLLTDTPFSWDFVLNLLGFSFVFGFLPVYWLPRIGRLSFSVVALASFAALYIAYGWVYFDYSYTLPLASTLTPDFAITYYEGVPLLPETPQPIFNYDDLSQIWKITLPTVIVLAIGVNLPELLSGWWSWAGAPRKTTERGAWITGTLIYVMVITALVSVLTLYSPGINRLWELAWSGWAFATFVFALATFRWAKWGARALLYSGLLGIFGGFAFDVFTMYTQATAGDVPTLLTATPQITGWLTNLGLSLTVTQLQFWSIWSVFLSIFVWGATRRNLWGGIGLVGMLIAWYLVFMTVPMHASIAVFAVTNVALVSYVLLDAYPTMETDRFRWRVPTTSVPAVPQRRTSAETPQAAAATEIVPELPLEKADDLLATHVAIDNPDLARDTDFIAGADTAPLSDVINDSLLDIDTVPLELDTQALAPDDPATELAIKLDTSALSKPSKNDETAKTEGLSIKLDTSALSKPKPETPASDDTSTSEGVSIKLDTSALSKPKPKKDTDSDNSDEIDTQLAPNTGVSIKLDTSALSKPKPKKDTDSDSNDETDTQTKANTGISIKLDTSALSKPKNDVNTEKAPDDTSSDDDS